MSYSAWSVVAGETPTAAKWNILGSNDASFNDGTGIGTNAVAAASLATNAISLGVGTPLTTNFTTTNTSATQVTGLSATVTIPAGGRRIEISVYGTTFYTSSTTIGAILTIWDGTVGSGTLLRKTAGFGNSAAGGAVTPINTTVTATPSAGSKTYNVGLHAASAATATIEASSDSPCQLIVKAI